jgi:hypothetical protein
VLHCSLLLLLLLLLRLLLLLLLLLLHSRALQLFGMLPISCP